MPRPTPTGDAAWCSVPTCDRPSKTRGMCGAHTERVRSGLPLEPPLGSIPSRRPKPFETLYTVAADGCWEWQGAISSTRYGRYARTYAHRWSYEHHVGPIPDGLHIDHLCRNTLCVNPAHLEPVTSAENMRRGMAPSAIAVRTNLCAQGHELTEDNVYRRPSRPNKRECRTCQRARWAS